MYGLVNRALEELVRSIGGDEVWHRVVERVNLSPWPFEAMTTYEDEITFALLDAAAPEIGLSVDEILERFGRYWIVYTAAEGWGSILDSQGASVIEVLGNLNDLHSRLQITMPDMRPPSFVIRHATADRIDIEYHSCRAGLGPMVAGMLRGLAERLGEDWLVTQVSGPDQPGHDKFVMASRVPAGALDGRDG